MLYDEEKHFIKKNGVLDIYEKCSSKGTSKKYVTQQLLECRMGFGTQLSYSDCGDKTGGKPRCHDGCIDFDTNGQLSFISQRNHPRMVQEPSFLYHYFGNCDLQVLFTNSKTFNRFRGADKQEYGTFIRNMHILGTSGLEQYSSNENCIQYTVGYACKGGKSTPTWNNILKSCANAVLDKDNNANTKKVINKFMYEVGNSRDVSRDEASFALSGGRYYYNS